jgi:hypothetical protein
VSVPVFPAGSVTVAVTVHVPELNPFGVLFHE